MTEYRLPQEKPVALYVNGEKIVTLMASPEHLRALALGYLCNRGLLPTLDLVERLYACDDDSCLMLEGAELFVPASESPVLLSGCGQSGFSADSRLQPVQSDVRMEIRAMRTAFTRMLAENHQYRETGGLHTAAIVSGPYFAMAEDVGRHNAHDKVTGMALEAGVDLSRAAVLSTGRISCDMVLKAVHSGVPVLASLSVPTSLAAELAAHYSITLIGRMMREEPVIFTGADRIILPSEKQ